jgi:hypothetical protein
MYEFDYSGDGDQFSSYGPSYDGYPVNPAEMYGYQYGNVADAWNSHAQHSDYYLDQAWGQTDYGNTALWDAANNLGKDPAAVEYYLDQALDNMQSTNNLMWQSLGPYNASHQFDGFPQGYPRY